MGRVVTVVVHGTFADQAKWWRLGSDGAVTFADRLESELSRRGLADTVWTPALDAGLDYESFAWSGRNRHRDRVQGARRLSSALNELARRVQATLHEPLTVNFVAHSHGGNVVLEALTHLNRNVRTGNVVLLGTPLVMASPAFRIARFVLCTIVLALLFVGAFDVVIELGSLLFTGHPLEAERIVETGGHFVHEKLGSAPVLFFPLILIALCWLFWLLGNLCDVVWRIVCRLYQPVAWMRGKSAELVYGPSPKRLVTILAGRPILLFTTHNDEADLLLRVGSAPAQLYREYVATKLGILGRVLEFALLRPFTLGVFLKAIEMVLQILSLGFSPWRALVQSFEVASPATGPYYPSRLLVQERPDIHPHPSASSLSAGATATHVANIERGTGLDLSIAVSLREVTEELKRQIQLRHSAYYEDEATIVRVAESLTQTFVDRPQPLRAPASRMPQ